MSRFDDGYDEPFNNAGALYHQTIENCLAGKRGQVALKELEAVLVAMPEKELIGSSLCFEGKVCAVGAIAVERKVKAGMTREEALKWLEEKTGHYENAQETVGFAVRELEMFGRLAEAFAYANDEECFDKSPARRHEKVLAWVRSKIKAV